MMCFRVAFEMGIDVDIVYRWPTKKVMEHIAYLAICKKANETPS